MKILHIYGHTYGGNFVITQLKELAELGHDITLICPGEGAFSQAASKLPITVIHNDFQGSKISDIPKIIKSILSIRKFIKTHRPDVAHFHLIKAIIVGRLSSAFIQPLKTVSQLGGPLTLETPIFRRLDLATAFLDDEIICSSEKIKSIYEKYRVTRKKCSLVHYAFPLSPFLSVKKDVSRAKIRSELGIPEDKKVIGMVAYMYKSDLPQFKGAGIKGHEVLLEAASLITKKNTSITFLIVGQDIDGGDDYLKKLIKESKRLGLQENIIFTGFRSDIPEIIAAMDIVAVPSLSENCGGAVEPLLMGIPVVASNVGGLPDVVVEGETGWLATPGDAISLSEKLQEALNCSKEQLLHMGESGSHRVISLFTPKTNAKKIEAIYLKSSPQKKTPRV